MTVSLTVCPVQSFICSLYWLYTIRERMSVCVCENKHLGAQKKIHRSLGIYIAHASGSPLLDPHPGIRKIRLSLRAGALRLGGKIPSGTFSRQAECDGSAKLKRWMLRSTQYHETEDPNVVSSLCHGAQLLP